MNKAQFTAALAPHFNGSKKESAHAVDIVFDTIVRNLSKMGKTTCPIAV